MLLQNKFEAQRALLKNGMILRNCVMVGVQTLAMQHKSFFDGSKDDEAAMKVPESKLEAPPLPTGKVRPSNFMNAASCNIELSSNLCPKDAVLRACMHVCILSCPGICM